MNTQNTALLVMDMEAGILGGFTDTTGFIDNVAKAIATARTNNIPIIYVVVGFRQGMPEISSNNKSFSASKAHMTGDMTEFMKIDSRVAPAADEITVVKRRISAFTGSDLEIVLRAKGIQHIVLSGISTSGVVLSTTREAADKDYQITILADACADRDEEVHRVLTTKVFPRQADVINTAEWL